MRAPSRRRRVGRGAALLALTLWSTACFHYAPVGALPQTTRLPNDLRVQIYDGRVEFLQTAEMVSDTIVGVRSLTGMQVRIPLAYVDGIDVKTFSLVDSAIAGTIVVVLFSYLVRSIANRPGQEGVRTR